MEREKLLLLSQRILNRQVARSDRVDGKMGSPEQFSDLTEHKLGGNAGKESYICVRSFGVLVPAGRVIGLQPREKKIAAGGKAERVKRVPQTLLVDSGTRKYPGHRLQYRALSLWARRGCMLCAATKRWETP